MNDPFLSVSDNKNLMTNAYYTFLLIFIFGCDTTKVMSVRNIEGTCFKKRDSSESIYIIDGANRDTVHANIVRGDGPKEITINVYDKSFGEINCPSSKPLGCSDLNLCHSLSIEEKKCAISKKEKDCREFVSILSILLKRKDCKYNKETGITPTIWWCEEEQGEEKHMKIHERSCDLLSELDFPSAHKLYASETFRKTHDGIIGEVHTDHSFKMEKVLNGEIKYPSRKNPKNIFNQFIDANNQYKWIPTGRKQVASCLEILDSANGYMTLSCNPFQQYVITIFKDNKGSDLLFYTYSLSDSEPEYGIYKKIKNNWTDITKDALPLLKIEKLKEDGKYLYLKLPRYGTDIQIISLDPNTWNEKPLKILKWGKEHFYFEN